MTPNKGLTKGTNRTKSRHYNSAWYTINGIHAAEGLASSVKHTLYLRYALTVRETAGRIRNVERGGANNSSERPI